MASTGKKIIIGIIILVITLTIGILMHVLGKYEFGTIILTILGLYFLIGGIYFVIWYFILRKKIQAGEFMLPPEEALRQAREEHLNKYGLLEGKNILTTTRMIGEDKPDPYLLWIYGDKLKPKWKIGYFRNLNKIWIGLLNPIIRENVTDGQMLDICINEMKSSYSQVKEEGKYVVENLDEHGNVIKREIGQKMQVPEQKEKTVDVVKE